ncbi:M20/M25/M40 family metallo-hydrolase [Microbacterium sp. NPDC088796]
MTEETAAAQDAIDAFLESHLDEMVERLSAWVEIPSVSAAPERRMDGVRSAHWIAAELRDAGFTTSLLPAGDAVTVFAEREGAPGSPTVLVYTHHDVRHAKPEEWSETAPFAPVLREGRLYGRGASDAKGQALAHVWAHRAVEADPDRFVCDLVVFSDTLQWEVDSPAPVTSMRGTLTATLTVQGPDRDVHSGAASGVTVNPALVLSRVLAQLHDEDGGIAIPGFHDGVAPLSDERAAELDALPFDPEDWTRRTETRVIVGEEGFTPKERLWVRPAIEVISLLAGDPEGIERSVIPREAMASLSIRTVADQRNHDVADALRAFIADVMPAEAPYRLEVDEDIAQEPYVSRPGPYRDALERALARGYGRAVRGRMGNAGGGPAELLSRELGAPVVFLGTGLPEDHWHASDESIDLRMLVRGAATLAHLWRELAAAS